MPVVVHFVSGDPETYPTADAANLRSGVMVLSRRVPGQRHPEEVAALLGHTVTLAEVMKNDAVQRIVLGLGQRKSN